jgi:hypothetical protein
MLGAVAGSCKLGNEPLWFVKGCEFFGHTASLSIGTLRGINIALNIHHTDICFRRNCCAGNGSCDELALGCPL